MSTHRKQLLSYRVVALLVAAAMCLAMIAGPLVRTSTVSADPSSVWGTGTLTEQNLWDLIAQMSVAEENTFIHGSSDNACSNVYVSPWVQGCMGQAGWIPGIPTLGIPPLRLDDGPAGSRLGHVATAMPAPIGLTASFDRSLAYLFGLKVGTEQRSLNQDVWLAPMMNAVNVPTAGRNFETTGEDPYLAGEIAKEMVLGSQSVGFLTQIKHYVDNDFENGRNSTSVMIDERTQFEMELQAFEKSIKAGAASIMCSYNRVNDAYACGNDLLLNQIARGLFGFKGFVTSDWGATHTKQDLINGLDMEQPGSGNLGNPVIHAILLTTTLISDASAGATNIKVASVIDFMPGHVLTIDAGAGLETATVAVVSGGSTTVRTATAIGATVIPVASSSGFAAGQTLIIDSGANLETAVVQSTTGGGNATITVAGPLAFAHAAGVQVSSSALTLSTPLIFAHASGTLVSTSGTPAVPATNDMPAQPAYTSAEWKTALDTSVFRILTQMNNASLLEGTQYGTHSNGCNRNVGVDCTPFVPARPDLQQIVPDMFAAAQHIAEASAVLLKNEGNVLPLTCADLTTGNGVVLMGPTAISTYTGGGGSAHVRPFDPVQSSYDALLAAATAKCGAGVKISYVPGYDIDGPIVPSSVLKAPDPAEGYPNWTLRPEDAAFANQPGLLRQQITTDTVASGAQPVFYTGADAAPDQLDATVNYVGDNGLPVGTAWRWTGTLTAPADGSYALRIFIANQSSAQLFTDGLTTSNPNTRRINQGAYPVYFPDSMTNSYATQTVAQKTHDPDFQDGQRPNYNVTLTAGQQVHLDLRVYASATKPVRVQFRWVPTTNQADQIAAAVAAASTANKVVDFVWDEGSEGSDRGGNAIANGLALAGYQNDVVAAVVAANPNTAIVLNTGDSVFMPWASSVKSILEMWYPGQMGGPATANVLLGNVNPGGKLPETFYDGNAPIGQRFPQDTQPAACADNTGGTGFYGQGNQPLPGNPGNCPMYPGIYLPGFLGVNSHGYRTINYSDQALGGIQGNGIFQGYRWFDKNDFTPLFPFGHGLSYTEFEYSDLAVQPAGDGYDVTFVVKNVGPVAGIEVPQVYVGQPLNPPVPMAEKALAGFERIELAAGEYRQVTLHIGARELSYWSVDVHDWVVVGGFRPIYVGSSSRDIRLVNWAGFFPPVSSEVLNEANAGSAVSVKFSLYGDYGLDIFNPGNPLVQPIDCASGEPVGAPVPALSVPGLKYDPVLDQYIYLWKTDKSWAGTCAQLQVQVDYDTIHTANFAFVK
jgi:beta-glucosidase-like glycosyl hydrolase